MSAPTRFRRALIISSGSHGDLLPFLAIGRALAAHGLEVRVIASAHFAPDIATAGLACEPIGTDAEYRALIDDPELWHPRRGPRLMFAEIARRTPEVYARLEALHVPRQTLVVASSLSLQGRLLQEARGADLATVHLAPSLFRSRHEPLCLPDVTIPAGLPAWLWSALWRAVDGLLIDPLIAPALNRFRGTLGLAPVRSVMGRWWNSTQLTVGLFPEWFGAPQPDWPPNAVTAGFPRYDPAPAAALDAPTERFLAGGAPPVVFTAGTAMMHGRAFFDAAVMACRQAGCRGVLLTRFRDQLPQPLPPGVAHFDWLPLGRVLPRCAALVHHGGVGTMSEAFAAGIPQIVCPTAFDQFDNGARVRTLGAGTTIVPRRLRDLPAALAALLGDAATAETARALAGRIRSAPDPVDAAVGRMLALGA